MVVLESAFISDGFWKNIKPPELSTFERLIGGEGGIRTLETLLGFTRFPVVRPRPG